MDTKNTKFNKFQLTKEDSKNLKGGYADNGIGGGGTGSNGFVIWDDVDPRDNGFILANATVTASFLKVKKK